MNTDQVYLNSNLVIEPLFDNWYAWSHLISPATAAMNIVGRHLKIKSSYIQEVLKGYVELICDLNKQPSFRFFESLLYNNEFYKETSKSILLWLAYNNQRPFVLSMFRLGDKNKMDLNTLSNMATVSNLFLPQNSQRSMKSIQE